VFVNETTGERVLSRCKATRTDLCPSCAQLYQGDAKAITRSGVWQRLEVGDTVTFLTLTAPPMWRDDTPEELRQTHRFHAAYWKTRHSKGHGKRSQLNRQRPRAICGWCTKQARSTARAAGRKTRAVSPVIHGPDDPLAGIPVDPTWFDYDAAAQWNWDSGERWNRFMLYLERELGSRPQFLKAREVQRRGLAHLHVLIAAHITDAQLHRVIDKTNSSYLNPNQGWGSIADVQYLRVDPRRPDGRQVGRVTSYIAKYVTKSIATTGSQGQARRHLELLREAAQRVALANAHTRPHGPCPDEFCGGTLVLVEADTLRCRECRREFRHRIDAYTQRLGIRAQPITKSQHWATEYRPSHTRPGQWLPVYGRNCRPKGLTFGALRRNRARHAATHSPRDPAPGKWRWIGPSNQPSIHPSRPPTYTPVQRHAPPIDLPDPY